MFGVIWYSHDLSLFMSVIAVCGLKTQVRFIIFSLCFEIKYWAPGSEYLQIHNRVGFTAIITPCTAGIT